MKEFIEEFLKERPSTVASFGYGSGVFKQLGYNSNDKVQIDLILVVNDIKKWHEENMKKNPKDYSFIGRNFFLNSNSNEIKGITGITYQSNIEYKNHLFKYGIIEYGDFVKHMQTWDSFYVPGRFQKPILTIKSNNFIDKLIIENRKNACKVSLLCLDSNELKDLYLTICSLSYSGDTRMKVAENPRKVDNIVGASFDKFNEMYDFDDLYTKNGDLIESKGISDSLPLSLEKYVKDDKSKKKIMEYLSDLNKKESSVQTFKGIKTNGIVKSIKYGFAKVLKKFR